MIILKAIIIYLLIGVFINLFVYFAIQSSLRQKLKQELDNQAWEEAKETSGQILQCSFDFDLETFVLVVFLWPMFLRIIFTRSHNEI